MFCLEDVPFESHTFATTQGHFCNGDEMAIFFSFKIKDPLDKKLTHKVHLFYIYLFTYLFVASNVNVQLSLTSVSPITHVTLLQKAIKVNNYQL